MKALVDNDVIHKLAAADLIDDAFAAVGLASSPRLILPTARFRLGASGSVAKGEGKYGAATFARMRQFIERATAVPSAPHEADVQALSDKAGIDQGEAILFSLASRDPDCLLLTGDKKSLHALVSEPALSGLVSSLTGRVICFEQLVLKVIAVHGFESVRDRLSDASGSDSVLRLAFTAGALTSEATVVGALMSFCSDLIDHPSGLMRRFDS